MEALKQSMREILEPALEKASSKRGAIGYLFAWLLGVPASLLLIIYLLWG